LHDVAGNVLGFSKVTRDLTDRKMREDKIKQYTLALELKNKELEQFAFAAAHDMKEPLRKIQFYNRHIADHAGTILAEKENEYLNRSISAASRMYGLIDDLLAYSATSPEGSKYEETDLNKVLDDVISSHQDTIRETNSIIKADTLPLILGIPVQFCQLFENLIGNSLKYRHRDRPLRIDITAEKVLRSFVRQVPADPDGLLWKISFADNGIGFDPLHADKIFDLFHRLPNETPYPGSGIGLAICHKVVQNHGGFITANGEQGRGAIFNVYLPCS
jgi:light-regulated signal transduction histidine kinase (bacteriophytochrome)